MNYAFAFPILPGMEDEARAVNDELLGPRRAEYDEFQRRSGVTHEMYFLQYNPEGSLVIVVGEGSDDAGGMASMDPETHEIDRFMIEKLQELTGIDMTRGDPPAPPELLGEWKA